MEKLYIFEMKPISVCLMNFVVNSYCQSGLFDDALELFEEMQRDNIEADKFILSSILSACGRAGNLVYGKALHDYIIQKNIVVDRSSFNECSCDYVCKLWFHGCGSSIV